jgi:hypothetical protein
MPVTCTARARRRARGGSIRRSAPQRSAAVSGGGRGVVSAARDERASHDRGGRRPDRTSRERVVGRRCFAGAAGVRRLRHAGKDSAEGSSPSPPLPRPRSRARPRAPSEGLAHRLAAAAGLQGISSPFPGRRPCSTLRLRSKLLSDSRGASRARRAPRGVHFSADCGRRSSWALVIACAREWTPSFRRMCLMWL